MSWQGKPISAKQKAFILSQLEDLQGLSHGMLFSGLAPKLHATLDSLTQGEASELIEAIKHRAEANKPLSDEELDNIKEVFNEQIKSQ